MPTPKPAKGAPRSRRPAVQLPPPRTCAEAKMSVAERLVRVDAYADQLERENAALGDRSADLRDRLIALDSVLRGQRLMIEGVQALLGQARTKEEREDIAGIVNNLDDDVPF